MKKITLWLFALFTCWQISAQTTVTIGTGTNSATGGTNGNPIYRSSAGSTFNFSQSIQLLTAADLATAGVTSGATITKIAFYKNDAFTMSAGRTATMNIYLKNSSATALTTASNFATWTTGSTNCYSNAAIGPADFPAAAGWVEYTLTTPFNYSGGAIETAVDWAINTGAGNATTGAFSWLYTTSTAIQAVGTSNGSAITGNLATSQLRQYNTQITFTTTPCSGTPAPGNTIAPSPICAGSSATLSLQNATVGSGVTYQWYMNATPISGATSGVYVIPSVTSTENYYCEVTCGGNTGVSSTVAVGPTLLTAPTTVETFATYLPSCWLFGDNGDLTVGPATFGTNSWKNDGFANVGGTGSIAYNHYTTGANDWIISPVINIPATGYELKFDASLTQWNGTGAPTTPWDAGDVVEVLISTTGLNNWSVLYTIDNTNPPAAAGSVIAIDLDTYASQNVRFAYRVVSGLTDGIDDTDIFIDNFEVRLSPTCPDQTGLTVTGITGSGANTSWDDMSVPGAIGYEYAVTTSATPPASGTATASTFYIASGLLPQTVYYLHVRSECAGSIYGNWATTTFTTGCAPITVLPNVEPFTTFLPNCWNEADNGDLIAGPATTGTGSWVVDGLGNVGATGAIRVTLDAATDNDWVLSPEFTIPALGYELKFIAAANQGGATTAPTTPWESDDFVEVLVTTTNNTNWTPLYTFNNTNVPSNVGSINVLDLDTYSGQTVRFAFRAVEGATNGTAVVDFSVDNFEVRLTPPCADQTGLTVTGITGSGANTSWDDMSVPGAIGYEYAVTTSATPPVSGTATASTFYIATGLLPQTVYYLHVRTECSGSVYGAWSTVTFTTACASITSLPWNEGFEGLTTVGTTNFPPCWSKENGDWASQNTNGTYSTANTGTNYIRNSWSATNEFIWTPGFDLVAGTSYDFSSFVQGDNGTGWVVDYFVNSSQNSTGATQIGGAYNVPGTGTPYAFQPYAQVTRSFVPATTGTYYFAVRVNQPSGAPWYVSFDDFKLELSPACPTPSASAGSITDVSANLSWVAVPSATLGYEYVLDNVASDPAGSGTSTTSLTYSATGLTQSTVYYFHIRSVCSAGTYSTWSTVSFTTLATPPVNDNCGSATVLTPGATFATNPLIATNVGASGSAETAPGCASYLGGDVWYSVTVPLSGNITIETDTNTGTTITDTGLAVYSGVCGSLVLVLCDDDTGTGNFSLISLTGRTPGEILYVRAWEYNNDSFNTFQVSAYDASLSSNSFDTTSFVAYPNPVKDVLNLSYKNAISNVRILNLLGQEVLNTKANTNDVQVNMSALTAGAYIVNITVEDTVHTIKVIKE